MIRRGNAEYNETQESFIHLLRYKKLNLFFNLGFAKWIWTAILIRYAIIIEIITPTTPRSKKYTKANAVGILKTSKTKRE